MGQIKRSITFESEAELQKVLKQIPPGSNFSDETRKRAWNLPARNKSAGAPEGNKNAVKKKKLKSK